jgi:hypothetical protein
MDSNIAISLEPQEDDILVPLPEFPEVPYMLTWIMTMSSFGKNWLIKIDGRSR